MNTSMGYHTFSFFQKTDYDEFYRLSSDFILYANKNTDMKRFPVKKNDMAGWEYVYKNNKGIRWVLLTITIKNGFMINGVMVIINPKALIEKNYISAAQESDIEAVEKIYNEEAERISPVLLKFGSCSMKRVDHCLNIDLKELGFPCTPEQMIALIKRGKIPKHYNERKENYDEKQHRKVTDKNSFYLDNKSVTINFYWKFPKQNEKHPNYLFREMSRNVIRFEVQCKYPLLYNLSKNIRNESKYHLSDEEVSMQELYERIIHHIYHPSIPIDLMLSSRTSNEVIRKYLYKIIRMGDYFTLNGAVDMVESYNFRKEKEERIIYTLEMVNKYRGITKAQSSLIGLDLDDFKRSLRDLDDILVNPVTIPRRWNIKHIPNPLRAYYDSFYEEQLLPECEYMARRHIDEFLQNENG